MKGAIITGGSRGLGKAMAIQLELDRHHELAEFLRSRRARVSPERVGLPRGGDHIKREETYVKA